jgi:type VI secretion system protein ImpM
MPAPAAPGFYGKLPARGDFLGRRLARSFVDAWDGWLQEAILASRAELGDRWLGLYLSSPIWRFALSAQACGPEAVAGVMIPSVDSVGRYFPLMVGSALGPDIDLEALVTQSDDWYAAVEARVLSTLEDGFALESLDEAMPTEPAQIEANSPGEEVIAPPGWHFPAAADSRLSPAAFDRLRRARPPLSAWWTEGSEHVAPCCLIAAGLPRPHAFASMLDGQWIERGWMMLDEALSDELLSAEKD